MNILKKDFRLMIRLLVKEAILCDDRVEVYYNYIDNNQSDDLDHQALGVYSHESVIDPKNFGLNYNATGRKFLLEIYL